MILGITEGALFVLCLLSTIWGFFRGWEMEMLVPAAVFVMAQRYLLPLALIAIILNHYVSIHIR